MSNSFRLFDLPLDALKRILLQMNPIILLDIHHCANKTTKRIVTSICKNKIDISVDFDVYGRRDRLGKLFDKNKKYLVILEGNGYKNFIYVMEKELIEKKQELVDRTFGTRNIPCVFKKEEKREEQPNDLLGNFVNNEDDEEQERNERKRNKNKKVIITYWENIFDGVMDFADFVCDVFASPIAELTTSRTMSIWSFRRVIQWIISRQSSIDHIVYTNNALSEEDISMFFGNCNVIQRLTINMKVTETIRNHRNFDLCMLRIGYASWITSNYILDMDCVVINLSGTRIPSGDLNMFIKSWLNGTNPRLQVLTIFSKENLEKEDVLNELTFTERNPSFVTRFKNISVRDSVFVYPISGGYDIRRSDGTLATIHLLIGKLLRFVIWTDDDRNGGWNHIESMEH